MTAVTRDRQAWFADFHVACTAVRAFREPAALGDARLLAWVLMPDHVHWLLQLGERMPLEMVVARMKAAVGVQANRVLFRAGPLWAPAFHDRALRREDDLRATARYIVANPLRAGMVDHLGDYPFWDSVWLNPV
nr:transposase [Pseudoxanthomonas koreensis]